MIKAEVLEVARRWGVSELDGSTVPEIVRAVQRVSSEKGEGHFPSFLFDIAPMLAVNPAISCPGMIEEEVISSQESFHEGKVDGVRAFLLVDPERGVWVYTVRDLDSFTLLPHRFCLTTDMAGVRECFMFDCELVVEGLSPAEVLGRLELGGIDADFMMRVRIYVFDLLLDRGVLVSDKSLFERRERLRKLFSFLHSDLHLRVYLPYSVPPVSSKSEFFDFFSFLLSTGYEGIISKNIFSCYSGSRSASWIKVKRANFPSVRDHFFDVIDGELCDVILGRIVNGRAVVDRVCVKLGDGKNIEVYDLRDEFSLKIGELRDGLCVLRDSYKRARVEVQRFLLGKGEFYYRLYRLRGAGFCI